MELANWLYIQTERSSLQLDHDAVRVRVSETEAATFPLGAIEGIVCFGAVNVSTPLIHRCGEDGRALVFLTRSGRFKARIQGPQRGNVLLRRVQHTAAADAAAVCEIVRSIVAGKVQASRHVLLRAARESRPSPKVRAAADTLGLLLQEVRTARSTDALRGLEGQAASLYFGAFPEMLRGVSAEFSFDARSRRPPRDRFNALLSFLYSLLQIEVVAALETTGLDPQVGFLHVLRPGRPALALDLLEELRAPIADRLALTLVNRRQMRAKHFDDIDGGAVALNADGRQVVLASYRERKAVEVEHPLLKQRVPWGLLPHIQARILARYLRGDLPTYLPFVTR